MKNRLLLPVFWTMFFDTASYTIRFPILALVFYDSATRLFPAAATMATRSEWYGICMALYGIGAIIAAPVLSAWSDYVGRRKVLVFGGVGTFLFALFSALGVYLGHLWLILVGALLGGLCTRMDPIAQAAVGDATTLDNKMRDMSYLQLSISIGAFIGPIIGGFLAQRYFFNTLNFALPFIIAAVFAFIGLCVIWFYFKETAPLHARFDLKQHFNFKIIITNRKVLQISMILILIQLSWSSYYQFIAPILKKDFSFSATEIGFFLGVIAFWLAVASALATSILPRYFSLNQILRYATFLMAVGMVGTLVADMLPVAFLAKSLTWVFAAPVAAGDVMTYCAITTLYSNVVDHRSQGQVMGACFIIVSLVWALTAFIGGWIIAISIKLLICFSVIGILLLTGLFIFKGWSLDESVNVRSRAA